MDSETTGAPNQSSNQKYRSGPDAGHTPAICWAGDPLADARCQLAAGHPGAHWGHGPFRTWKGEAIESARLSAVPEAGTGITAEQIEIVAKEIRQQLAEGAVRWASMTRLEQAESLLRGIEWEIKLQGWMLQNRSVEELLQAIEHFNAQK